MLGVMVEVVNIYAEEASVGGGTVVEEGFKCGIGVEETTRGKSVPSSHEGEQRSC